MEIPRVLISRCGSQAVWEFLVPLARMVLFFPISPFHSPSHLPTLHCALNLPVELSQVLFVCTASTRTLSSPLLDRMEALGVSGYFSQETI
ncbi:hypothetical protein BKA70DRAFT_739713 [Coprinopsis sp. MPI-PUGE-AT-0042]|nr:hypothetical protein BKA70DRAFT_739713 [Coprinopsis sp. MPI-PUGE-AT-0042]